MLFDDLVSAEFAQKVKQIASRLGMNPDHVMTIMAFETGCTFSPYIKNQQSSATGLIQFLEATAKGMGTTTALLAQMTAVAQLDYVERYFRQVINTYGQLATLSNAYMAVFYPAAIRYPNDYQFDPKVYAVNKVFDTNKDGRITKAEFGAFIEDWVVKKKAYLSRKVKQSR